ncbi:MAG: hypothetical protein K2N69_08705 [Helicobacter sp.]|nr:hypothetical protein [Helicobacter sp.]
MRSSPLSPFNPQPLHALQLIVLRTDYVALHSACVNVTPTARTLPLCAVVGNITLVSNGESKIAESKAALRCGFAIALRALFLGILSC